MPRAMRSGGVLEELDEILAQETTLKARLDGLRTNPI